VATGTITITSGTAALTFSFDGGTYAPYPVGGYTGITAGAHTFTAQNASNCISAVTNITVNAQPPTPTAPSVGTISQPTCTVSTGSVVLNNLPAGNWTINPGAIAGNTASTTINNLAAGTYNYTVTNGAGCTSAATANIVIDPVPGAPAAPTVSIIQPTCTTATAIITVTSATAGVTFSLDGASYAPYPAGGYTGVAAGPHTLTLQNAASCISPVTNITVNAQPPTPAAPTVSITQPTCTVATGIITVTSATAGLTFSIDGGAYAAYPAGGYIVLPGAHTISAQNAITCISSVTNFNINSQPVTPAAPTTGSITQPTCAVVTGTVELSGLPSGNWIINPGAIAGNTTSTNITGLVPATYNFTVTNAEGCTSPASANVVIDPVAGTPPAPTANVVQPTCTVATGNITITSSTSGLTFSLDGGAYTTYPAGGYVVAPGAHTLTAQNAAICTSPITNITVNAQPATPAAPTVVLTQPTCITANGTITITSTTAGLNFSLDGGAYAVYPAGGYIVLPGAHTLSAQNASTCISEVTNITVNTQPPTPVTPTVSVAQPTCTVATGIITITSATAGLTFSLDGGAYATYPAGGYVAAAGAHTLTAQNASTCISPVNNITVNAQPPTPAAPAVAVLQPTCSVATGTISITSATAGLNFSLDGGAYAAYPAGGYLVAPGAHTLIAQNASTCISAVTNITVNAQPPTPVAPTVAVLQPNCSVATGTITITSATAGLNFSLDGGVYAAYPAGGYVVVAGAHTLTAQNTSNCISAITTISVNAQPPTPAAPTISVTQPNCTVATGTIIVNSASAGLTFSLDGGAYAAYPVGGFIVAAGAHTLTAQNASNCISTVTNATVNIQPLTPTATAVAGTVICNGGNTTLTVTATGGTSPYQYSLNGGTFQAGNSFTVPAGLQTVTVRGANTCTTTASVTVSQPTAITAAAAVLSIACNGGTTILTVTATGGTAPYQYSLNGGAYQTANTFTVGIGIQTVTVRDANLCTKTAALTVTQPAVLTVAANAPRITTCGGKTLITISAAGGRTPYTGTGTFVKGPGTFSFTVTDASGCAASTNIIIDAPGCMDLEVFPNPASNTINVNHSVAEAGAVMQVFAMNGALLFTKTIPQDAFFTTIDISRLPVAAYVLVFINSKDKKSILFEKLKH